MRTTIRIDDHLLSQLKQLAAQSGRTMTEIIEDALRESLNRQQQTRERVAVSLTTVPGNGILPGVDLDDSAALLSVMEETDDPA